MSDYTLRNIPGDLHRAWKAASAMKDITMLDYCFIALRAMIKQDLQKQAGSQKKEQES